MTEIFRTILNMSVTGGIAALGVLLLRLPLKCAPRWIRCALWAVVFVRLALPFSFSAPVSLLSGIGAPAPENGVVTYVSSDGVTAVAELSDAASVPDTSLASELSAESAASFEPTPEASADPVQIWLAIGSAVWLAGTAALLLYAAVSYARLRRKVTDAVLVEPGVYETDTVASPFVLGIVRPRVILPVDLTGEARALVLRHERAHIVRLDHAAKPAAFLLLAVHWFNPLVWVAFRLFCEDMEASCDERAVRALDHEKIAAYGETLLRLGTRRVSFAGGPLAFGEHCTKGRIVNVLNYKKPAFWVIIGALVLAAAAAVVLLANPLAQPEKAVAPVIPPEDLWVVRLDENAFSVDPETGAMTLTGNFNWSTSPYFNSMVGSILTFELDYNVFGYTSDLKTKIETFLGQLADGQVYIRAYLKQNAAGCYDQETAERRVHYYIVSGDTYGYNLGNNAPEIHVGDEYWHCAQYYVFLLLHPSSLHWQHYGYAQYLGGVLNPYDIQLANLNEDGLDGEKPYMQAYLNQGGNKTGLTSEDYRLLVDAAAWYGLHNGGNWGTAYECAPIRSLYGFNGTSEQGDDMSVMMASSFCAYLADNYGFDQLTSYCAGQLDFKKAFGVSFDRAYERWQKTLDKEFSE